MLLVRCIGEEALGNISTTRMTEPPFKVVPASLFLPSVSSLQSAGTFVFFLCEKKDVIV